MVAAGLSKTRVTEVAVGSVMQALYPRRFLNFDSRMTSEIIGKLGNNPLPQGSGKVLAQFAHDHCRCNDNDLPETISLSFLIEQCCNLMGEFMFGQAVPASFLH